MAGSGSSTLRDRAIAGAKRKSERVSLALDGDTIEVEVRALSAGARGDLLTNCVKVETGDDGEERSSTDLGKLYPALIIASVHDPETGQPLFSPADLELVRGLDAKAFDPVIKVASRLSALGVDDQRRAEGNSAATTIDASASASPAS